MIRAEVPQDREAVRQINRLAFGQENEAELVDKLRTSGDFIHELSLVAVEDDRLVGHILFSPIRIVVVVGHPEYYPRFGFSPGRERGVKAPFPVPDEAFMILELEINALQGVTGTVWYPPPFASV